MILIHNDRLFISWLCFIGVTTVADLNRFQVSARDGPSDPNALAKWRILNRLHDRNETMYYKVSTFLYMAFALLDAGGLTVDWMCWFNLE